MTSGGAGWIYDIPTLILSNGKPIGWWAPEAHAGSCWLYIIFDHLSIKNQSKNELQRLMLDLYRMWSFLKAIKNELLRLRLDLYQICSSSIQNQLKNDTCMEGQMLTSAKPQFAHCLTVLSLGLRRHLSKQWFFRFFRYGFCKTLYESNCFFGFLGFLWDSLPPSPHPRVLQET